MTIAESPELFANRYILHNIIGEGGMGVVYNATDRLTQQNVALKKVFAPVQTMLSLSPHAEQSSYDLALAHEFQTLASLRHPNIISVLDYGFNREDDGILRPYFTMTLLEGAQNILEASKFLSVEGRLHLLTQVLQALEYLHQRGIVHHDLKPANILVVNEQVKLLDFGLALSPGQSWGVMGTLPYMAPEVIKQSNIGVASDLYAVGIIAYELFVGYHPFNIQTIQTLLEDIMMRSPDMSPFDNLFHDDYVAPVLEPENLGTTVIIDDEELQTFRENIAKLTVNEDPKNLAELPQSALGQTIGRLLLKDPELRHGSATEVVQELHNVMGQPVAAETAEIRDSFLQAANFVGRKHEQGLLSDALQDAIKRNIGSAWLVAGESGVGKTRLLNEIRVLAMVDGALAVTGQGVEEGGLPYQLWREVMRRLCITVPLSDLEASVLKAVVPDIEYLLGHSVEDAPPLNTSENQARLVSVFKDVIVRYGQPILLLLEDLQWTDASLAVLSAITDLIEKCPIVIIGSYRDDEAPELPQQLPDMKLIKLDRLSMQEIEELSYAMLGDLGKNASIVDLLHRETEGNVFFAVETVRALAEHAGTLAKITTIELPSSVFPNGIKDIVQRRLSNISQIDGEILQIAAVYGRELDLEIIEDVINRQRVNNARQIDNWLVECSTAALIEVGENRWRFTHDKIRQEILSQIPSTKRRRLHEYVAISIEHQYENLDEYAALLSYHWNMAGDVAKEAKFASIAGQAAYRRGSPDAIRMLERCVELFDQLPTPELEWNLENLLTLSRAYSGQGLYDKAYDVAEKIAALATSRVNNQMLAEAIYVRGSVLLRKGELEAAKTALQDALNTLDKSSNQLTHSQILMWLGAVSIMRGMFDEADRYLEEALEIARSIESNKRNLASIFNTQAENMRAQQRFQEAITYYQESIALYEKVGHVYALVGVPPNLAYAYAAMGNIEDAEATYRKALQNSVDQKNALFTTACLGGLAGIIAKRGELLEATRLLGLVMRHPATAAETRMLVAEPLMADLRDNLSEDVFEQAFSAYNTDDVFTISRQLLIAI